ncbi:DKNYY domain-containing protein [Stenotrophomonas maltophilia group sp. Smal35]|uniref:DKNYY domain-containing protein n=1 Tax=Stenotrophomonas maltophilia group sp. Smal35 TaxID=3377163 RepID=UPI002555D472|nr:DKNYY domain-containing protein [Stenotrophomonas maltophilia]
MLDCFFSRPYYAMAPTIGGGPQHVTAEIIDLPDQRFIGPYSIEYWRIHEGHVFHQRRLLRKPDAASFELMPAHHFIGRDAHAVYHAWIRQTSIDRDSFRQSGAHWLDNHAVYFEHETSLKALAGADCTTFRELSGGYGGDEHGGWYCGRRMRHCLRGELLRGVSQDPLYAVDDNNVYCDGKPLPGVDRARWRLLDGYFSGDGSRVYYLERKLPRVDAATWRWLEGGWSRDAAQLFNMYLVERDVGVRALHGFAAAP